MRYRGEENGTFDTAANGTPYDDDDNKGGASSTLVYINTCMAASALIGVIVAFIVFGLMGNRHGSDIISCKSDVCDLQAAAAANLLVDDTFLSQPCNCTVLGDPGNCLAGAVYPNITGNITEYVECIYA